MSGTRSGRKWTAYEMATGSPGSWNYPTGSIPRPEIGENVYEIEYTHTEPGMQRGNPDNDDSYMFLTLSVYKKFKNASKNYRTIKTNQRRKIKASF